MAITDKIYLKDHGRLVSQLGTSVPKRAFAGATLDLLFTGDSLGDLDDALQDRVLAFAGDFLDCTCESNPYCGHAERKFVRYLLELRTDGFSPEAIVDVMTDDYNLYAYPGDILTFLDDAVRTLDAVEALATVEGDREVATRTRHRKTELEGRP